MDENESWYMDENIKRFAMNPKPVDEADDDFKESNQVHAINGYIYSTRPNNGELFQMRVGEKAAWYAIGFGNELDIHTVHCHGNSFIHASSYTLFTNILCLLSRS